MKNILFITSYTGHGGTNRSLEFLLSLIDKQQYNCKVICSSPAKHGLYDEIFKNYLIEWPNWFQWFLNNRFLKRVGNLFHREFNTTIWYFIYKYAVNSIAKKHNIDLVVGYEENRPDHIASSFSGRNIVWVHCVFSYYVEFRKATDSCCFHRADDIVCVSGHAANVMKDILPEEAHKIRVINNLLDINCIEEESLHPVDDARFKKDLFTIVSVGRYDKVKQFHLIPDVARKVIDAGITGFRWYIIGGGDDKLMQKTRKKIKELQLTEHVFLLGYKDNPYPYMANSNLLVSTSRTESDPLVLHEALGLHIPVLSTDFPTSTAILDKEVGFVCSLSKMDGILGQLIEDRDGIYSSLAETCKNSHFDNAHILKQIDELFS